MNIFGQYREKIILYLNEMRAEGFIPAEISFDAVTAEPPRESSHGDISTNAAMVIAKPAGKKPREIAEELVKRLQKTEGVEKVEIAGPGFINLRLAKEIWQGMIKELLNADSSYGNSEIGGGRRVNVEYVSANPTGPMHIGHSRGAVVGDVIASLLIKAGYDVTREYYINDSGSQVENLAKSAYLRYLEALGEDIGEIPDGLYPGEYLKIVGETFAQLNERDYVDVPEKIWLPVIREFTLANMLTLIKRDLLELGVQHDVFISEAALVSEGEVEKCIKILEEKGLVYRGILEPPKGKTPEDWEPREQLLFRSTQFGDDVDRPLKKSDGTNTYFASDIAYHYNKLSRGFKKMVLELGADHGGYVKRIKAAVKALSDGEAEIDVVLHQLVNFLEDGEQVKMSKRAGTFTTVRDVIEAVGKDVLRFVMLTRKSDVVLDFDLKKVTEQSRDNPVFYVQYAHARAYSVFRNASEDMPGILKDGTGAVTLEQLSLLKDESELALIKTIAQWPRVVESAAITVEPHRIAFYLQELAAAFHALWNLGKEDESLRFIIEKDKNLTTARLALVKACAVTIASGLRVIGVEPVMEM